MGLKLPPFDCSAEHAVKAMVRSMSASKVMESPALLLGGSTRSCPVVASITTFMKQLNATGILSGRIPEGSSAVDRLPKQP